mmetsp:Transcript_131373/g.327657  ORF Transcript_131373/g.327657 Transcript_131373/m.327657 type:complete len:228 (+) Transcript_131373:58-741(+)
MALGGILSFSTVCIAVFLIALLVGLVFIWGAFLDKYEHDPGRVRAAMFIILCVATFAEMALCTSGITCCLAAWISIVVNVWGGMDALLRFPAAHDVESFFCLKQCFLIAVKTFAYAFGMVAFRQNVGIFLAVLLINIWGLPVLYTMALPIDPAEQVVKDDSYDVDLAVRVWQLASCSYERRQCLVSCKGWWYRRLTLASEASPLARLAICAASPEHRRALRKMNRSV